MANRAEPERSMSVTLELPEQERTWVPVSVVVKREDVSHRVTFSQKKPFEDVFCAELVRFIEPHLRALGSEAKILSFPDAELRMPDLVLGRVRVVYSPDEKGCARVLIRFSALVGNPNVALVKAPDALLLPVNTVVDALEDTLDWVLIPALNITSISELPSLSGGGRHSLEACLERLESSREHIMMRIEMVSESLNQLRVTQRELEQIEQGQKPVLEKATTWEK